MKSIFAGAVCLAFLLAGPAAAQDKKAEKKAKPVYQTTDRFLALFGLANVSELPRSQEIGRELP